MNRVSITGPSTPVEKLVANAAAQGITAAQLTALFEGVNVGGKTWNANAKLQEVLAGAAAALAGNAQGPTTKSLELAAKMESQTATLLGSEWDRVQQLSTRFPDFARSAPVQAMSNAVALGWQVSLERSARGELDGARIFAQPPTPAQPLALRVAVAPAPHGLVAVLGDERERSPRTRTITDPLRIQALLVERGVTMRDLEEGLVRTQEGFLMEQQHKCIAVERVPLRFDDAERLARDLRAAVDKRSPASATGGTWGAAQRDARGATVQSQGFADALHRVIEEHGIGLDGPEAVQLARDVLASVIEASRRCADRDGMALVPNNLATVGDRLQKLVSAHPEVGVGHVAATLLPLIEQLVGPVPDDRTLGLRDVDRWLPAPRADNEAIRARLHGLGQPQRAFHELPPEPAARDAFVSLLEGAAQRGLMLEGVKREGAGASASVSTPGRAPFTIRTAEDLDAVPRPFDEATFKARAALVKSPADIRALVDDFAGQVHGHEVITLLRAASDALARLVQRVPDAPSTFRLDVPPSEYLAVVERLQSLTRAHPELAKPYDIGLFEHFGFADHSPLLPLHWPYNHPDAVVLGTDGHQLDDDTVRALRPSTDPAAWLAKP